MVCFGGSQTGYGNGSLGAEELVRSRHCAVESGQ